MQKRVLAVLAGRDMPPDMLKKWGQSAEILIAADGAADQLLSLNLIPNAIVGDLDSCSSAALSVGSEIYKVEDQNYTDCDKLLAYAAEKDLFPITLTGVEGDRLDHMLGSLQSVARCPRKDQITLSLRLGLGWIVGPGSYNRDVPEGRLVSLVPLTEVEGLSTRGLKWELEDAKMSPVTRNGVSNRSVGNSFTIAFEKGILLITAEFKETELPIW